MNPKEAKKILPKKEYETFESILMNQISRTPAAKLKLRATLARRLRDKYRDLARHEAAGVRRRRTNETDTDINDRRARSFQDIIDRLEFELERTRPVDLRPKRTDVRRTPATKELGTRDERRAKKKILDARLRSR